MYGYLHGKRHKCMGSCFSLRSCIQMSFVQFWNVLRWLVSGSFSLGSWASSGHFRWVLGRLIPSSCSFTRHFRGCCELWLNKADWNCPEWVKWLYLLGLIWPCDAPDLPPYTWSNSHWHKNFYFSFSVHLNTASLDSTIKHFFCEPRWKLEEEKKQLSYDAMQYIYASTFNMLVMTATDISFRSYPCHLSWLLQSINKQSQQTNNLVCDFTIRKGARKT